MFRWVLILFVGIVAASMTITSAAHATEFAGSISADCVSVVGDNHAPAEQEQPAEKSVPAAHTSCHAPAAALPSIDSSVEAVFVQSPLPFQQVDDGLAFRIAARDIRPPIA